MPTRVVPSIGTHDYGGDVAGDGGGGFFSRIPKWAWFGVAAVVVLVIWTLSKGQSAQSGPAVSTQPDSTNTSDFANLSAALGQVAANEQQILAALGTISPGSPTPTPNPAPAPTPAHQFAGGSGSLYPVLHVGGWAGYTGPTPIAPSATSPPATSPTPTGPRPY